MKKRNKQVTIKSLILAFICVFGIFYCTSVEGEIQIKSEQRTTFSKPLILTSAFAKEDPNMNPTWQFPTYMAGTFSPFSRMIIENDVQANDDLRVEDAVINDFIEEAILNSNYQEPTPEPVVYDPIVRFGRDTDLTSNRNISVDKMNAVIAKSASMCGGTPFEGNGAIFIEASEKSGLNPIYIFAHACWESGYGKSSQARNKHNYFGIASYDSSPSSSYVMGDDMRAGIINGAVWIADNYYNQGQTTLNLMIYGRKRYASSGEDWIGGILSIMNRYLD